MIERAEGKGRHVLRVGQPLEPLVDDRAGRGRAILVRVDAQRDRARAKEQHVARVVSDQAGRHREVDGMLEAPERPADQLDPAPHAEGVAGEAASERLGRREDAPQLLRVRHAHPLAPDRGASVPGDASRSWERAPSAVGGVATIR